MAVAVAGGLVAGITLYPAIMLLTGRTAGAIGRSRQTPAVSDAAGHQYLLRGTPKSSERSRTGWSSQGCFVYSSSTSMPTGGTSRFVFLFHARARTPQTYMHALGENQIYSLLMIYVCVCPSFRHRN